jgi:hypothetical protein
LGVPLKLIFTLSFVTLLTTTQSFAETYGNRLECDNVLNFEEHKGQTYLSFMEKTGKPLLDQYATEGYTLKGDFAVEAALNNVSKKVGSKAINAAGGRTKLLNLAKALRGKNANLYTLPGMIAKANPGSDRYTLSTFLGLVSCGGAIVRYGDDNFAYNIHYGTGSESKDNRTGRSFGEGPVRPADDASDKAYLTDLEEFVFGYSDSLDVFYKTLIESLANSDSTGITKIHPFGQTLLTDFLAVYTAEQARNLMDGKVHIHWDAALLEVTLLGAFHAGQDQVELYFKDPETGRIKFTKKVLNQAPGGDKRDFERSARLYDYWQFSSSTDPEHRSRSGINITRDEFRTLGEKISKYERAKNPALVARVERHFHSSNKGGNIFLQISKFFINSFTPKSLGPKSYELAEDVAAFLAQVKLDAKDITKQIKASN